MTPASTPLAVERTAKRWTYEEYYRLTPESHAERYEIDHGELVPMASPTVTHQRVTMELASLMRAFVRARDLGNVFISPLDVILGDDETSQPDVLFIAKARADIIQDRGIFGAPDLGWKCSRPPAHAATGRKSPQSICASWCRNTGW